ncbi:MAG TPA: hypothetical protein VM580_09955 [Labilithrix sp.]|nr:hypothetical protein [Labilithrix sp.]
MQRRNMVFGTAILGGAFAVACAACSLIFSTSEVQCATDGDCHARGPEFASTHCSASQLCVANEAGSTVDEDAGDDPFFCARIPSPTPDSTKLVDLSLRIVELSTGAPPADVLVRLCSNSDAPCNKARPLQGEQVDAGEEAGAGWAALDDAGAVYAKVEIGFDGFFQLQAPGAPPTYQTTSPPLWREATNLETIFLRTDEVEYFANTLFGKVGLYNPNAGLVLVFAKDCYLGDLAGITFTTTAEGPDMHAFYIIDSQPSLQETKTGLQGGGGFVNVPPGLFTFTATWAATGERLGAARVLVRAGSVTIVDISPTP